LKLLSLSFAANVCINNQVLGPQYIIKVIYKINLKIFGKNNIDA
jgi:hypothetical protein